MLSIQTAGVEILSGNPRGVYFFFGKEYGVKEKYVRALEQHYGTRVVADSLYKLLCSFGKKSLTGRKRSLYVSYYDSEFSSLSEKCLNLVPRVDPEESVVVAVYEDDRLFKKLDKLFPNNTVRVDEVHESLIAKYLRSDFPSLDPAYVNMVCSKKLGYGKSYILCSQITCLGSTADSLETRYVEQCLGIGNSLQEDVMIKCCAAKDPVGAVCVIDSYRGDFQNLINGMCHVSIELDKAMDSRSETPFTKYTVKWTRPDVYNFFDQAYSQLMSLRSGIAVSSYDSLLYLASLLRFSRIPSVNQTR